MMDASLMIKQPYRAKVSAGLLCLAALGAATQAAGDQGDPRTSSDVKQVIVKMREMPRKDKDATITKEQYLELQGHMFDMAAPKGAMSMPQFRAFMKEFKSFGAHHDRDVAVRVRAGGEE